MLILMRRSSTNKCPCRRGCQPLLPLTLRSSCPQESTIHDPTLDHPTEVDPSRNTSHHHGGVVRSGTRLTRCVQVRSEQLRYLHPATWPDRLTGPFPNRGSSQNGLSSSKRTAVSSLDSSEPALTPNLERPTYLVVCRSGFTCTIA